MDEEHVYQIGSRKRIARGEGQSMIRDVAAMAEVFGHVHTAPGMKTFSWKEPDTFLSHWPRPQAIKDKKKANRQKKRKRKQKRGY